MAKSRKARNRSILDMSPNEARAFLLKQESYCTIDLPPYFSFSKLLKKVSEFLDNETLFENIKETSRHINDITASDIQSAIVNSLRTCPNYSCTLHSLTSRVLREIGIITRGNPRLEFEKRVLKNLNTLETRGAVEKYKAKNKRIRLVISD